MVISATKFIITEIVIFVVKLIYEEKSMSSPEILPNFTHLLVSKIEEVNGTFNFKEVIIQPDRLHCVEEMRKEIVSPDIDKPCTLARGRGLNGKKTIISIWSFKR